MRRNKVFGFLAVAALLLAACGDDDEPSSDDATTTTEAETGGEASIIRVPQDQGTIQEAVDAAEAGDLVLVDEGVYNEAVDVTTADITIRGVDRNKVILDGGFELENGIRVLDTEGVVVENMTARNYVSNGFFWTGSDRYRGSYLTAYRNGDYGVYSFDAYHGQFDNSYGGGSPDAGFYIGECYPCDAVIDNVISENNGLGYSGTNSGGDLYIVNSTFRDNRAGIVPNTGAYELCYPNRSTTMVGNIVHGNNNLEAPGIDISLLAHGNGIVMTGTVANIAQRNLVYDHERWGILVAPFPEEDANDVPPPADEDDVACEETRDDETATEVPDLVLWHPRENQVLDNVVSESGTADIGVGTIEEPGITFMSLGNCAAGNTYETSEPVDIEALIPCEGETNGADWAATGPGLFVLLTEQPPPAEADAYKNAPEPGLRETMPGDVEELPAGPYEGPETPDLDAIAVPEKPAS